MTESMPVAVRPKPRCSGNSIIELTFMMPWLLFLFVGVFDFGFYAYALIATQNAARAVAVHNSISSMAATDPDGSGCQIVIAELQSTSNSGSFSWQIAAASRCRLHQLAWQTRHVRMPTTAKVVVTYQTAPLIPIPGLLPGQLTITRTA